MSEKLEGGPTPAIGWNAGQVMEAKQHSTTATRKPSGSKDAQDAIAAHRVSGARWRHHARVPSQHVVVSATLSDHDEDRLALQWPMAFRGASQSKPIRTNTEMGWRRAAATASHSGVQTRWCCRLPTETGAQPQTQPAVPPCARKLVDHALHHVRVT